MDRARTIFRLTDPFEAKQEALDREMEALSGSGDALEDREDAREDAAVERDDAARARLDAVERALDLRQEEPGRGARRSVGADGADLEQLAREAIRAGRVSMKPFRRFCAYRFMRVISLAHRCFPFTGRGLAGAPLNFQPLQPVRSLPVISTL